MDIGTIYLIKPLKTEYGIYHLAVGEKLQLGVYIAKNEIELERIQKNLRSMGYRKFDIDTVRFESLTYVPTLLRQRMV
jgi:hypothetical protein